MIVPNYVPDPVEVPGNVTEQSYGFRIGFIRRVTFRHLASVSLVALLANYPWPSTGLLPPAIVYAALLVALDLWRIVARAADVEAKVSGATLPLLVLVGGWLVAELQRAQWPVWASLVGIACAALYSALCSRDFSFVGCFFLSWIVSSVIVAFLSIHDVLSVRTGILALAMNSVTLFYHQYDLASLLSRRRPREEWAAVVDLYRDIFNFFGYIVRCVRHWRKHRIWEIAR